MRRGRENRDPQVAADVATAVVVVVATVAGAKAASEEATKFACIQSWFCSNGVSRRAG